MFWTEVLVIMGVYKQKIVHFLIFNESSIFLTPPLTFSKYFSYSSMTQCGA